MRGGRSRERGSFDTGEEEDEEKEEEEKEEEREEEREVLRVASRHKRLYDRRPFRSMKIAQAARYQPDTRSFWPASYPGRQAGVRQRRARRGYRVAIYVRLFPVEIGQTDVRRTIVPYYKRCPEKLASGAPVKAAVTVITLNDIC